MASKARAVGAAVLLVAAFFLGGGTLVSFVWASLRQTAVSEYFQGGHCREVSWPGSVVTFPGLRPLR